LLRGDKADVFSAPYSLVMTSAAAQKYFGDDDPLGQTLTLNDEHEFTVTGILADIPRFTQIRSNIIAGSNSLEAMTGPNFHMWGKIGSPYTYLLVGENFNAGEFEAKLPDFLRRHMPPRFADMTHLFVQPLKDIYLRSDLKMELSPRGNIQYVYLFPPWQWRFY